MDILFDEARLLQLVTNLYVLTGITANILDPQGRDIHLFKDHPPFCRAINDLPEGHRRCVRCDMWKVANYNAEKGFQGLLRDAGGAFRLHSASGDDFAHRADGPATAGAVH